MSHSDPTAIHRTVMNAFFSNSSYQMIDIGLKTPTQRTAIASGEIHVGKEAFELISNRALPKGDALVLAEIAGINGAKIAYQMIPLCHPIGLDLVKINIALDAEKNSIKVHCIAAVFGKTGVEMEALAGVNAALLAIYDLTKMVQPALELNAIRLLFKSGGKNGVWIHPAAKDEPLIQELCNNQSDKILEALRCAVICLSDRASKGIYPDESGTKLKEFLIQDGANIVDYRIVPDDSDQLKATLTAHLQHPQPLQLIVLTGGTGVSKRDITPDVLPEFCTKMIPGLGELLRIEGAKHTPYAWLSRSTAGVVEDKGCLIIALPGSPKAVSQNYQTLRPLLPHLLKQIVLE